MRIRVPFAFFADVSRAVRRESEKRPAGDGWQKRRRWVVIKRGNAGIGSCVVGDLTSLRTSGDGAPTASRRLGCPAQSARDARDLED
jgi:hypothetical protein